MSLTIFLLLWIQERMESGMRMEPCTMPPNSWIRWGRSIPSPGSTTDCSRWMIESCWIAWEVAINTHLFICFLFEWFMFSYSTTLSVGLLGSRNVVLCIEWHNYRQQDTTGEEHWWKECWVEPGRNVHYILCFLQYTLEGNVAFPTFTANPMESINSIGSPQENGDIADEVSSSIVFHP